jgi:transposase
MPESSLADYHLLPEMELSSVGRGPRGRWEFRAKKTSPMEVCPRCATPSHTTYDRRRVSVKDEPLRGNEAWLIIEKRRFWCRPCGRPFTEPVGGIIKGKRTTERYARAVQQACDEYVDLKTVRTRFRCSGGYLYNVLYRHLELKLRMRRQDWPERIGLDEHFFKRGKGFEKRQFVTMVVDQSAGRLLEVAEGRTGAEVAGAVGYLKNPENVRWVSIDLCDPYKLFVSEHFPNASIVADKFHVLRLPSAALMKYRKQAEGGKNTSYLRNLLLKPGYQVLDYWRPRLHDWLKKHPALEEVYWAKERLSRFYRIKSVAQAAKELTRLTDSLCLSRVPELRTLRQTLKKWRSAILNFWTSRMTNARVEGFNNKAKLVKRRAYGYISFRNYRLRLLNACRGTAF